MKLTLVLVSALVLLGLVASSFERDEHNLPRSPELDAPLQILSYERAQAELRKIGYRQSFRTLSPIWVGCFALLDRDSSATFGYLYRESIRSAELLSGASGCTAQLRLLRIFLSDREKGRMWLGMRRRFDANRRKFYEKNDRSPDILAAVERNVSELEAAGYGCWATADLELAADYHFATGCDEEGVTYLSRALSASNASLDHAKSSHLAGRLGAYHTRKGAFEQAEESLLSSLSSARMIDDPFYISRALSFLSLLKGSQGHFLEAESLQMSALDYCECVRDPVCAISKLVSLARIFYSFGETDRAEHLIEKALLMVDTYIPSIRNNKSKYLLYDTMSRYQASALALLASIQSARGEHDIAVRTMQEAVSIGDESADRHFAAGLVKRLGDAYAAAGMERKALLQYRKAVEATGKLGNRRREAEYLTALAALHLENGRSVKARELLCEALETARREGYWMQAIESKHLLGRAIADGGQKEEAKRELCEAIALFDRESAGHYGASKHALIRRAEAIYADLFLLESETSGSEDSLLYWAERERRMFRASGESGMDGTETSFFDCTGGRGWIPPGAAVIQHLVTPGATIILVTDGDGTHRRTVLIPHEELERRVLSFIDMCRASTDAGTGDGPEGDAHMLLERSRELFGNLVEPVEPFIRGKDLLCFIEDGFLGYLPFGALLGSGESRRFLVESHHIITAPGVMHLCRRRSAGQGGEPARADQRFAHPLLVGDPVIDRRIERLFTGAGALPGSGQEIERIATFLPSCRTIRGPDATKRAFMDGAAGSDLIHIATHTVTYPVYGGQSALVLSRPADPEGPGGIEDLLLTPGEIRTLDLSGTGLVILSACESHRGKPGSRRGIAGIAGAFLDAGAVTIVSSLWTIEDMAARRSAERIYEKLFAGSQTVYEAVRSNACRLIEEDRAAGDPARRIGEWAPYIVTCSFRRTDRDPQK